LGTEGSQNKQDLMIMMAFPSICFPLGQNVALPVTRNEKGTSALLGAHDCGAKVPDLCNALKLTANNRMFDEVLQQENTFLSIKGLERT
jgi:hypothetical protein